MGMFEMSDKQVEEWREKCRELVEPRVERRRGRRRRRPSGRAERPRATSPRRRSSAALVYAGIKMLRKKKAGGLPDKVMIAVTPDKVYAFKLKVGRDYKLGDEVAVWDRGGHARQQRSQRRDDGADDRVARRRARR